MTRRIIPAEWCEAAAGIDMKWWLAQGLNPRYPARIMVKPEYMQRAGALVLLYCELTETGSNQFGTQYSIDDDSWRRICFIRKNGEFASLFLDSNYVGLTEDRAAQYIQELYEQFKLEHN